MTAFVANVTFPYVQAPPLEHPARQIILLSSGTVCTLTGLTRYDDIDVYTRAWWGWATDNGTDGETWQTNHERFVAAGGVEAWMAGNG
jgi:hypothetical protein